MMMMMMGGWIDTDTL